MPIEPGDHHGTVQGVHLNPETGDLTTTIEVEGQTFTHTAKHLGTWGGPSPAEEAWWEQEFGPERFDLDE